MRIGTSNPQSDPAVLSLDGHVCCRKARALQASLRKLTESRAPRIYVDLSNVESIDDAALAVLVEARERSSSYGGEFALIATQPALRNVLHAAQLDMVFSLFPDCYAALHAA